MSGSDGASDTPVLYQATDSGVAILTFNRPDRLNAWGPDIAAGFYAAIDRATGRVWTAPTKEVAHRQAQEAGLKTFTERVISKDNLLESLGIEHDQPMRVDPGTTSHERPAYVPPPSKTPWFIAGY